MTSGPQPDRIELRGLRALGTHGVLPEEQVRPQPFEVDVDIETDLRAAGATDRLEDTVDYAGLAAQVADVVAKERYALLERLAQRIADVLLADPRVISVTVALRKLRPPVALDLDSTGVRLTRSRP